MIRRSPWLPGLLLLAAGLIIALIRFRPSLEGGRTATPETGSPRTSGSGSVSPLPPPPGPVSKDGTQAFAPPPDTARVARPSAADAIADEYILSFFSARDRDDFVEAARALGAEVLDTLRLGFSVRLRARPELLARLREEAPAAVEFESNYAVRTPPLPVLDPRRPTGDVAPFGSHVLEWLGVRDNATWGRGILVAVLDSGVNPHPALANTQLSSLDLVGGTGGDPAEGSAHGTAVASVIAGQSDAVRGIAPAAGILNIRVMTEEGAGDAFTAAKGIVEAVDRGAAVINCSFGTRGDSFLLRSAVEYAAARGVPVVASVGNEGGLGVSYPAAYPTTVAVPAVDARGEHLYFSNRGEEVDIAAPGLGINAAWTGESVAPFSGTSASTPLVSGAIAALMSRNPGLSAGQAVQLLKDYSDDAGAPGPDSEVGHGIMNLRRVEERNERGIHDMAAGRPYVIPAAEGGDLRVHVFAQNTGTEPLDQVTLAAEINGTRQSLRFSHVRVGQTVSHEFTVSREELELTGRLRIASSAEIEGVRDVYPENNVRRVTIVPGP